MSERPLPDIRDPVYAKYFEGCSRHELCLPFCRRCRAVQWPPRITCPHCQADDGWDWRAVSGDAELYSWTTIWRVGLPGFDDLPLIAVVVQLKEEPTVRILSNAVDCSVDDLTIGIRLEPVFLEVVDAVTMPYWRPLAAGHP